MNGFSLLAGLKRGTLAAGVCLTVLGAGVGLAGQAQAAPVAASKAKPAGLFGVSCVRPSWCMAVGAAFGAHNAEQNLAETWNGTAWHLVTTPAGTGLGGVSCSATWYCLAFGVNGAPALRWNGSKWLKITAPRGATSTPSCASRTLCIEPNSFAQSVLSWNGSQWKNTQLCGGTPSARCVTSTSCANTSLCMTVGSVENEIYNVNASASVWNGKQWSNALPPDGYDEGDDSALYQVSCAGQSCLALGSTDYEWDNTTSAWQDVTPDNGVRASGRALSCSSGTDCMVISGVRGNPWWHAGTWSNTQFVRSGKDSQFTAVSCKSGSCLATGFNFASGEHAIAEFWNGSTWRIIAPKAPAS
jgi:hypothetical protein